MTERNPILQSLFDRKSVRVYEEKPIPAEMKQAILEAAAQAPSAGCQQLYTILDITDPALKEALADRGILVRHYAKPGLENCIRVSAGRPEQTDVLLAALAET